jgi:hypothetical protein
MESAAKRAHIKCELFTYQEGVTAKRVPKQLAEARAERNRGGTSVPPIEGNAPVAQFGRAAPF